MPGGAAGWTVPGYSHVRELGASESGRVVLAVDDVTKTPVAIKYLRGDAAFRQRYRAEADALTRVEDPNLVQVYEYAEEGESAAVVTEYVEGTTLRRLLDAPGGIDPEAALSVLSGSLLALAALHDNAGLTHRGFRPENVLIATDGTTKISDVGVGAAAEYVAPEREAGPAADIYAATAVFVECMTGAHAVPAQLRDLVAAGLSADPAIRPTSAADFLTQLDEVASAAYGAAWEPAGRTQLAQHVTRAAALPPAEAPTQAPAQAPAPERSATESAVEDWAPLADEPDALDEQPPAERPPAERPPAERPHVEQPPVEQPPAERPLVEQPRAAAPPVERSPFGLSPFGPSPFGDPREDAPPAAIRPRPQRRWTARARLAAAVAAVVAVAAAATWYVVSGRNSPDPIASAQTASPGLGGATVERVRPPKPADLATEITRAVATRRGATFVFRAAGVAAQGALKYNGDAATAYDMTMTPLAAGRPDRRHPVARVILVDGNAYVGRGGWKAYPIKPAGKRAADPGRLYASLAADTRWGSSVNTILALMRSSTRLQRTGLTYRGVASVARLTREGAAAELYQRIPRSAVVTYTIEMAQSLLPRQLVVTIKAPSGQRTFRTTYTGWGQRTTIAPPGQ